MDLSLFTVLEQAGLTTLRLAYDWRLDQEYLFASCEWDDLDWSRYARDFTHEHVLTQRNRSLDHAEVRDLFGQHELLGYLDEVFDLLRLGRHQGIDCFYHKRKNIRFMSNMHSNTLGIANGRHAIRAGGIRRHGFEDMRQALNQGASGILKVGSWWKPLIGILLPLLVLVILLQGVGAL